jgi:transposase
MHDAETYAEMRRLYYGEHWKIGTIAAQLQVHPDAIHRAINRPVGPPSPRPPRPRRIDPFLPFLEQTLQTYPRLRATVLHRMLRERGYTGSVVQLRRIVRQLRPVQREAFLRLQCLPGEAGQVDWADFGCVQVGRAKRRLSVFVLTLSYSRALYAELFFDQSLSNFLTGHQHAFEHFGGVPRQLLSDNLRSVVLERRGDQVRFHPRYLQWAGHYCFQPQPCHIGRGNEKGRVERSIRYLRESFWAAQGFTGLYDCNRRLQRWIGEVADARPWPDDPSLSVAQVFNSRESLQLLPLPADRLDTSQRSSVHSQKTLWIRFDRNDYSIPPEAVGRDLTLLATATEVRFLDGPEEIARHDRCYDQGQRITDPEHTAALLKSKKAALASSFGSPLHCAVPELERFLQAAFPRARSAAGLIPHLKRLLELYGADALNAAILEALQRGTPTLASVEYLLEKNRRADRWQLPLPVDLSDRPELLDLHVKTHPLSAYDQLAKPEPENEDE